MDKLTFIMLVITYLGNFVLVGTLVVLSIISFAIHKHYSRILPLVVSIAGSSTTILILKYLINRPRPTLAFYLESTPAFPSMHACLAIAFYGFILCMIWKHDKHILKNIFITLLLIIIISIGISRLYLGVHYLTDVMVGYVVGLIWLFISIKLYEQILRLFGRFCPH